MRRLHTPAGLKYGSYAFLLSIISSVLAMLSVVFLLTIDYTTITPSTALQALAGTLTLICIAGVLALVVLIFYLLLLYEMYVGRHEFGEKHASRASQALILIILGVVISFALGTLSSAISGLATPSDPSATLDAGNFRNDLLLQSGLGLVGTIVINLGLVLFPLEIIGREKRGLLWLGFGLIVASSFLSIILTYALIPGEGLLEIQDILTFSAYSSLFGSFSIFGVAVLFFAYRAARTRILNGEILPVGMAPAPPPPMYGPPQAPPPAQPPQWGEPPPEG